MSISTDPQREREGGRWYLATPALLCVPTAFLHDSVGGCLGTKKKGKIFVVVARRVFVFFGVSVGTSV